MPTLSSITSSPVSEEVLQRAWHAFTQTGERSPESYLETSPQDPVAAQSSQEMTYETPPKLDRALTPPKLPEVKPQEQNNTDGKGNGQKPPTEKKDKAEAKKKRVWSTIYIAAQDVRSVLEQQRQQANTLTTKLNILFVVNGALLTSLTLSRLMFIPSIFSLGEIAGFMINFTLLINAFLPRQVAISPNLEDKKFLERYLSLTPEEYHLKMMVNLVQTYKINKQRIDDVSQTLNYAAYVTLAVAFVIMLHTVAAYFLPVLQTQFF
ncbi:hypothetical protein PN462_06645 [Spirulina sp. CS-785/01]|uniref:hypothetical protein n=1 Tax=Spirulina sp. CS-785/01 TaxID=3021716 RepID=UPI00232A93A9|nr:hypothetical protein [Spirulina sp. CS-785/01]MDB9312773.1 hypothetical protein [Spirulina sp. CS-785/01]